MDVPASIQRIEQFPASGLALLNKIPARSGESIDIGDLLEQEPFLLNAVGQIAGDSDDPAARVERIPTSELIEIVITLMVRGYLQRALSVFEDRRYWRYTLACAISCQEIAWPGENNRLIAYVAGLLHDVGRLALIAAYPDKYANLLTLTDRMFREDPSFDLLAHERMLFGLDHFATGSWLAAKWGLPPWLRAITGKFDAEASGEYRALVTTIRSGTRLAHSLGFGYLQAAPRAEVKEVLGKLPAAWARWQTLDYWKHGEEHMCTKIQSKLSLYALRTAEDE